MQPLIIVGSQGCGKTRLAQLMADFFGYSQILDPLESSERLAPGVMALTNSETSLPENTQVLSFNDAVGQLIAAGKLPADWKPY